jgi:hypothetical protein
VWGVDGDNIVSVALVAKGSRLVLPQHDSLSIACPAPSADRYCDPSLPSHFKRIGYLRLYNNIRHVLDILDASLGDAACIPPEVAPTLSSLGNLSRADSASKSPGN